MKVTATRIPDVLVFEPKVFGDARGFFMESFNSRVFDDAVGRHVEFVQDNHSRSARGVLRGLHYQIQQAQGKLVRVTSGAVFDVAVEREYGSIAYAPGTATLFSSSVSPACARRLHVVLLKTTVPAGSGSTTARTCKPCCTSSTPRWQPASKRPWRPRC